MGLRHPVAAFFALAYGISWLLWAPLWLPALGITLLPILPFQHALGALGPISAAFLVAARESGRAGPLDLARRMGQWRTHLPWLALALFAPAALVALAVLGASLWAHSDLTLVAFGRSPEFPAMSVTTFLIYNIVSFGFGEEVGWRGFALPRLQSRYSALHASVLLTIGWAGWHIPLFLYRPTYMQMGGTAIIGWLFSLLTGAILLTWLYNETHGSLLIVAVFHATVDIAFASNMSSPLVVNGTVALITLWGVAVLLIGGPTYLSRRGKVVLQPGAAAITGFANRQRQIR